MDPVPHDLLGGRDAVLALANRFYDAMERDEAELTAVHDCEAPGKVSDATRDRFGLFLVGWLGGERRAGVHGAVRAPAPADAASVGADQPRDAWLRAMATALDKGSVTGEVRAFLDERFAHVANFLHNVPEEAT